MIYTLPIRDPDVAYRDTWLWLPKKHISVDLIRNSLTIPVQVNNDVVYMNLWKDSPSHLGIPREKINVSDLSYPVVDLTPSSYEKVGFRSRVVLDYVRPEKDDQKRAFEDLAATRSGILNLGCGIGKTVIAIHHIAHRDVPALIINDKTHILKQWIAEINKFLFVPDELGWIQGHPSKWNWKRPIALASLKTLAMYADQIPPEMATWFGTIIWDEIHHLSAEEFSKTADMFYGSRFGLTATVKREDGGELLYLWHVGDVVHKNLKQDVIPSVTFFKSYTKLDMDDPDTYNACTDRRGEVHLVRLIHHAAMRPEEIEFAKTIIDEGIKRDRDIMAITFSKDHADFMHSLYPGSGVLHASIDPDDRLGILRNSKLTFATVSMAKEALNKQKLDSLIILTEFSNKNVLQQAVGRIQRFLKDKKKTKVIVIWHVNIRPMKNMGYKLMGHFREWGMKVEVK